ncbi:MAG: hypothetical protein WD648_10945 [Planctomycetaceae bacterium]
MTQYRMKCPNKACGHTATMEATSSGGYVKKHFVDLNKSKNSFGAGEPQLLFRCPKCNHRWRVRVNQVRPV